MTSKLTTGGSGSSGDFSLYEKFTASDFKSVLISMESIISIQISLKFYLVVMAVISHLVNRNIYLHFASFDFHFVETWP